jgi:hypothetical protein
VSRTKTVGRDLDALVAEKVMGFVVNRRDGGPWHLVGEHPFQARGRCCGGGLPPYSTDIGAAWEVVEKIWDGGRGMSWRVVDDVPPTVCAEFWEGDHEYEGIGQSAPHAICLAALAAVKAVPHVG